MQAQKTQRQIGRMRQRRADLGQIGAIALKDRIGQGRPQIGQMRRFVILGDVAPFNAIKLEQLQHHRHRNRAFVLFQQVDIRGRDAKRTGHLGLCLSMFDPQATQTGADKGFHDV